MQIFVADDEPTTLKLLARTLSSAGHTVRTFTDGDELWEAYAETPVPLVVTDWAMPRMNGVTLCKKIRKLRAAAYTHVVMVTSLTSGEHMVEALDAGVDDYVEKPFEPAILLARIAAFERSRLGTAESALRQALEICQDALGAEHSALLNALESLSDVCRKQRSYVRCRAFLRRQLSIAERAFGPEDPRTAQLSKEYAELRQLEDEL